MGGDNLFLVDKVKDLISKELNGEEDEKPSKKIMDFLKKEAGIRDKRYAGIERIANSMDNKSDDELKTIYQTSSGDRKMAAGYILKQRGY